MKQGGWGGKDLRVLRNQSVKFEVSIKYLMVYESLEFRGIVRCRDIKWELLRRQIIFTPPIRLNGVSRRVCVGKEEKSETLALGLSNRLKGKGKRSQRSSSNEGRRKIKRDWCPESQVKKWVGDRVNDQLSWELKSLDLAIS